MSGKELGNQPVFDNLHAQNDSMTKREMFAMAAITGLSPVEKEFAKAIAERAVQMADALCEALAKGQQ